MRISSLSLLSLALVALPAMAQMQAPLMAPPTAPMPEAVRGPAATPSPQTAPVRPVVRQMTNQEPLAVTPAAPAQTTPAAASAPPSPPRQRTAGGEATRGLLALQASGRVGGPPRPVLGPTATAAWERYLESFSHPIPEWFEVRVEEAQP